MPGEFAADDTTLNDGASSSEAPSGPTSGDGSNLLSTVRDELPSDSTTTAEDDKTKAGADDVAKAEAEKAAADQKVADDAKAAKDAKEIAPVPYDRFKDVNDRNKAYEAKIADLEARVNQALAGKAPAPPAAAATEEKLPYTDVTAMEDEAIIDSFQENPKAFLANIYAQIRHEISQDLTKQSKDAAAKSEQDQFQTKIASTFNNYAKAHPDFQEMWDKGPEGDLQKYMKENPGHNAISAHMALTEENRIQAATEKAGKEAADRTAKNFQAKKSAQTIGTGPAVIPGTTTDERLKDTSKFGGKVAALADRLRESRQARGAT